MNEQTEKLKVEMAWVIEELGYDKFGCADQILKACKEAGLVFKHDCENCPQREEDGYGLLCVLTCAEPFKEIDIEQEITE